MSEDPELAAIRASRMAQMQQAGGGMPGGMGGQDPAKAQEARENEKAMKNQMLGQILDQSARARLNTISLTKPEKAQMIENMLIQMARQGQIQGKMNEASFKSILEQVNQKTENKIKITRKRYNMSDDEDDF